MGTSGAAWKRGRGLERLLAQETNVSDLLQLLSDRDPSPWERFLGVVPDDVVREASTANNADLLLTSGSAAAVVEVKLGHLMSDSQQEKYEALGEGVKLYLAALEADEARIGLDSECWTFLRLGDLFAAWTSSKDVLARSLASDAASVLQDWDGAISGTLSASKGEGGSPVEAVDQKFLARVVSRRIANDLRERGRMAYAGVASGGGVPLVAAWVPIRGEGDDRCFIAEIRWQEKPGGALRFGVDFDPRPGKSEDEEVRRSAYDLACSMEDAIHHSAVHAALAETRPDLAGALRREKASRPTARGDWEQVILHGHKWAALNSEGPIRPPFYRDGALRFQAISDIDFSEVSAVDLVDLLDLTLEHLAANEPK